MRRSARHAAVWHRRGIFTGPPCPLADDCRQLSKQWPPATGVLQRRCFNSNCTDVKVSEERLQEFLQAEVVYFANLQPKSLTMRQILDAKTPHKAAKLAFNELPIRYAQRILQIEGLQGWKTCPQLVEVHRLYSENFRDLRLVELNVNALEPFTSLIEKIKGRMRPVIPQLATGMRALQHSSEGSSEGLEESEITEWLDAFFLSRIGTEMLTSHYLAIARAEGQSKKQSRVGVVDYDCDPVAICEQAARHTRKLCKEHFLTSNDVDISVEQCVLANYDLESRIRFPYVPNYLFYIMVELLKNSARATVEAQDRTGNKRSIVITIGADPSQVAIRVLDQAGGIPFGVADRVWSYMYSTARNTKGASNFSMQGTPLAGYGVGLPLSRLYARYLGGSLDLQSLPGGGTAAYLYLKRLESEAREELPTSSSVSGISLI
eukprot:TRINITY_DN42831_c0_g1_i1.p1 TRINITY_DN42831_c0_g1~~TRINITY_DN42831_c0_g1_i1.p1  ORF type:complete len:434 (-),score=68.80 TRINITY_DN42831_c0_g1_i1:84-1385(-)